MLPTRFRIKDTAEVLVNSAYKGEIGTVVNWGYGEGMYVLQFADGSRQTFAWYELKASQQTLPIEGEG